MNEHRQLVILLAVVAALQVIFGVVMHFTFGDWEKSGVFGDTFGAVNSLFSSLAFGALIYTVILQSKELKLQREELKLTRDQIADSAAAQKDQARYTLLAAQISAAVSKQKIYADHYLAQKQFPGQVNFNLGDMRTHLACLIEETDSLVKAAARETTP